MATKRAMQASMLEALNVHCPCQLSCGLTPLHGVLCWVPHLWLDREHPAAQDGRAALAGAPREAAGVYIGCVWQEYAAALELQRVAPSVAVLTGSGLNFMAGRNVVHLRPARRAVARSACSD